MKAKKCPSCNLWNDAWRTTCSQCKRDLLGILMSEYVAGQEASWHTPSENQSKRSGGASKKDSVVMGHTNRTDDDTSKSTLTLIQTVLALVLMGVGIFIVLPFLELQLTIKGIIIAVTIAGALVWNQVRRVLLTNPSDDMMNQTDYSTNTQEHDGDGDDAPIAASWQWKCGECHQINSSNSIFCKHCGKVRDLSNPVEHEGRSGKQENEKPVENRASVALESSSVVGGERKIAKVDRSREITICPICATRQRSNRSVCYHCAAEFRDDRSSDEKPVS